MLTATNVAGLSERLTTVAAVLEAIIPNEDPPAGDLAPAWSERAGSVFAGRA